MGTMKNIGSILTKVFLVIGLSASILSAAQEEPLLASERYPELRFAYLIGDVYFNDYIQVKGEAFMTADFVQGDILLTNGRRIEGVEFKLDAYAHRVMLYHDKLRRIVILDKYTLEGFVIEGPSGEREFRLLENRNTKAKTSDGVFVEVLTEGDISLYKLFYRDILPLRASEGIFLEEFIPETLYYFEYGDEFNTIKLRRRALLRRFPEYKTEIRTYLRKQKLQVRNQEDFIIALNYINELLALRVKH